MPTPLHDRDALRALAEGPRGTARDWALGHLAALGTPAGLPDDPDTGALALAAGAPIEPLLQRIAAGGRVELEACGRLATSVMRFGRLPADAPEAWFDALRGAVRGRGWSSDVPLARLLTSLGGIDAATVGAAARAEDDGAATGLPSVVLGYGATHGADLDALARDVAHALARRLGSDRARLGEVLAAVGIPRAKPERPFRDLEEALFLGGNLAGADETPPVSVGRGSLRRRMQNAARELLDGSALTPASALVRALLTEDDLDAGLLLVAATWLRTTPAGVDAAAAVLDHGAGEDPSVLTRAAAGPIDGPTASLAVSVAWQHDPPAAALAARLLATGHRSSDVVAEALVSRAATALDEPRLQAALAIALARDSAPLSKWFEEPRLVPLALYHARHAPHEEVLQRLLDLPVPEAIGQRRLLARALSSQGDPAALRALDRLVEAGADDELDAERVRAREILGIDPA